LFQQQGIRIPYPKRDLYVRSTQTPGGSGQA
jgi:small-conductance mechanosensitive channel